MVKVFILIALLVQGMSTGQGEAIDDVDDERPTMVQLTLGDFSHDSEDPSQSACNEPSAIDREYETFEKPEKDNGNSKESDGLYDYTSSVVDNSTVETELDSADNVTSQGLSPEEQIAVIKAASKRMAQSIEREFASLVSMITAGKRNKRDISDITGSKYLLRLLKHIRANNEHQNSAIDKMMSGQELAEQFGIELIPDFKTNGVSFEPVDLNVGASENTEKISSDVPVEIQVQNETVNSIPTEDISNDEPITDQAYDLHSDITPANVLSRGTNQIPGAYFYYQVDTPVELTIQRPEITHTEKQEPELSQETADQAQNHDEIETHPEYTTEQLPITFVPQGTNLRPNPFNFAEESPISYVSMLFPEQPLAQEPIDYAPSSPVSGITTEVEEQVVSEATVELEGVPKVTHRCSTYRLSRLTSAPHYHSSVNALPQQYQYYFSLV